MKNFTPQHFIFWFGMACIALLAYFVALGMFKESRIARTILDRVIPATFWTLIVTFLLVFVGKWILSLFYQ